MRDARATTNPATLLHVRDLGRILLILAVVASPLSMRSAFAGRWVAKGWVECLNCAPPENSQQWYQIDRNRKGGGIQSKAECHKNLESLERSITESFRSQKADSKLRFGRQCSFVK